MYRARTFAIVGTLFVFALLAGTIVVLALPQETGTSAAGAGSGLPACPALTRNLKSGSTGDDVRRLQLYLARDPGIYPEAQVNGTFGTLTEMAVKRFQVKFNIVTTGDPATTGFGAVGTKTMAAIAQECSGSRLLISTGAPSTGGFLTVSPVNGNAPLTTSIQAVVNTANVCGGGVYNIDYGDGSVQSEISVQPNNCGQVVKTFSHTYRARGTYFVTLSIGTHSAKASVIVR